MKYSIMATVLLVMSLTACGARTQSARFIHATPAPEGQSITYFSARLPQCAFEELGVVRGYGGTRLSSLQSILDRMAVEARRMGGQAIIGITPARVRDAVTTSHDGDSGLFGTVIRFTAPDCTT